MTNTVVCFNCIITRVMFEHILYNITCSNPTNFNLIGDFYCKDCEMQIWHHYFNIQNISNDHTKTTNKSLCFDFDNIIIMHYTKDSLEWNTQFGHFNSTTKTLFGCHNCYAPNKNKIEL